MPDDWASLHKINRYQIRQNRTQQNRDQLDLFTQPISKETDNDR